MAKHNNSVLTTKKVRFYDRPTFFSKLNTVLLLTILGICVKIYLKLNT